MRLASAEVPADKVAFCLPVTFGQDQPHVKKVSAHFSRYNECSGVLDADAIACVESRMIMGQLMVMNAV